MPLIDLTDRDKDGFAVIYRVGKVMKTPLNTSNRF